MEKSGLSSDLIKILEAEYGISFENNIWVSSLYEEARGYDEILNYLNSN